MCSGEVGRFPSVVYRPSWAIRERRVVSSGLYGWCTLIRLVVVYIPLTPLFLGLFGNDHFPYPTSRKPPTPSRVASLFDTRLVPVNASEPAHGAELAVAEADARVADHAGVEAQHLADVLLGGNAGVEAHGEVVARRVAHLMHADGLGEGELAPVLVGRGSRPFAGGRAGRLPGLFYYARKKEHG
ncbi:hypothetical protein O1611_g5564 [Lasiodiplodia mahajangana]|uniref:Uncharacterized protein n=1 Tax=Lasiodiplodia mahajangana TaxID=1108764 RepID=A0ACC2JKV0_9PEZI|nr:hypothetical protein O1611_g5564 [Lasiodiplodia mahajangana]